MLQPLVDDGLDVVVRQGVEHGLALPAGLHQPDVFQGPELVGDGRLGEAQQRRDVADAHLRLEEHVQDADPGGVPEDAEQLRQVVEGVLPRQLPPDLFHHVLVGVDEITALHIVAVLHESASFQLFI